MGRREREKKVGIGARRSFFFVVATKSPRNFQGDLKSGQSEAIFSPSASSCAEGSLAQKNRSLLWVFFSILLFLLRRCRHLRSHGLLLSQDPSPPSPAPSPPPPSPPSPAHTTHFNLVDLRKKKKKKRGPPGGRRRRGGGKDQEKAAAEAKQKGRNLSGAGEEGGGGGWKTQIDGRIKGERGPEVRRRFLLSELPRSETWEGRKKRFLPHRERGGKKKSNSEGQDRSARRADLCTTGRIRPSRTCF